MAIKLSGSVLLAGSTTINETEFGYLDSVTAGTSSASKAMVPNALGNVRMPDSDILGLGAGMDLQLYHDGTNSYIANKTGALKVATETSGIAITLGHSTSEVTVADNLTVTGDLTVNGTTTTVNSTAVEIGDRIIELNTAGAAGDAGLYVQDVNSANTGSLLWDTSANRWFGGVKSAESILVDRGSDETITGTKTFSSLVATTADINGGSIDGTTIGAAVPAAAEFTNMSGSGTLRAKGAAAFGPGNGVTQITAAGHLHVLGGSGTAGGYSFDATNGMTLSASLSGSSTLRVKGESTFGSGSGQAVITAAGNGSFVNLDASGDLTVGTITMAEFTVDGNGNTDVDGTLDVAGVPTFQAAAVFSNGITTAGAIGGGTTLALSGLASVASISMDDGSTLGPDSVADLWTFNANGDTIQKDGAYDFDIASHDGINGLLLGGVTVTATAAELNYVDVTTLGTAQASKAMTWASNSSWTAAGGTCTNLGTVSAATSITATDLVGTNIDGIIGADTARLGKFTALSASAGLEVAGALASGYSVDCDAGVGGVRADEFVTYSDRSLKTNIQETTSDVCLSKVMKLQPTTYEKVSTGKSEIGFIAQDVAKVVPEICALDAAGEGRGIDYSRMSTLLVGALKAQQEQIAQLKEIVSKLQK